MLQPWEKEFRRWNVNIPVYNFNDAGEQGRPLLEKHRAERSVQGRRPRAPKLPDFREVFRCFFIDWFSAFCVCQALARLIYIEINSFFVLATNWQAMVYEWTQTASVLLISYQMFNNLFKKIPNIPNNTLQSKRYNLGKILLDYPTIMILDEGHIVRNKQAQVLKQMHAVKTPLRVMLSGICLLVPFLKEVVSCKAVVLSRHKSHIFLLTETEMPDVRIIYI